MRLTKWYLDCVDNDGNVAIVYWASIAWRGLSLTSVGVLESGRVSQSSVRSERAGPPVERDGVVRFAASSLAVEVAMQTPPFHRTLHSTAAGSIEWTCMTPSGAAVVRIDDREVHGLGYAEVLEMTLPPWKIPVDELRWGRFTAPNASLVWIDWRGPSPLTLLLHDGVPLPGRVGDDAIETADMRLALSESRPLRDARVGTTLRGVRLVRLLLPRNIVAANEQKWCGSGALVARSGEVARGWTIHERVRFR